MTKALFIVDPENDFFEGGALGVPGSLCIIPKLNKLMAFCETRRIPIPVFVSRDWHPANTAHFKKWPVHCVAETAGAAFHSDLIFPKDFFVEILKGLSTEDDGYSPFEGTDGKNSLDQLLRNASIEKLYVCGLATDYCVKACVLDALKLGYTVTVITDAIAAVNLKPNDGADALQEMQDAGAILKPTKEVLNELI